MFHRTRIKPLSHLHVDDGPVLKAGLVLYRPASLRGGNYLRRRGRLETPESIKRFPVDEVGKTTICSNMFLPCANRDAFESIIRSRPKRSLHITARAEGYFVD